MLAMIALQKHFLKKRLPSTVEVGNALNASGRLLGVISTPVSGHLTIEI